MDSAKQHGPLPGFLVALTVVTGLVDAFSYLRLGHVFVANMTGNVVFLGFGLAGTGEISIVASLLAVLAFAVGAVLGGRLAVANRPHRGRLLAGVAGAQAVLVLGAATLTSVAGLGRQPVRLALIAGLAVALGAQNATVRQLAVPDLTTTVLTLTVTGLVADVTSGKVRARRIVSVLAMLAGALAGGLLLRFVGGSTPLWVAGALLVACAAGAFAAVRRPGADQWR